jgi:nucleotidyltransferase/DNA polymerase involved in DNA repair
LAFCRSQLYFASIEQELCPELRGQPIAIVPIRVEAQTGCCIAVSYQAKAYGVKPGFSVADAKVTPENDSNEILTPLMNVESSSSDCGRKKKSAIARNDGISATL